MIFTDDLIAALRLHLKSPDLKIYTSPSWGSQHPQHREKMRQELDSIFTDKSLYTSVSHCPQVGIVIAAPHPIGVDVENLARLKEATVARVSTPTEILAAPHIADLWCAKEACFKALRAYQQPSVISKVSIGEWRNIDSQFEIFHCLNATSFGSPLNHRGVTTKSNQICFAFFSFGS